MVKMFSLRDWFAATPGGRGCVAWIACPLQCRNRLEAPLSQAVPPLLIHCCWHFSMTNDTPSFCLSNLLAHARAQGPQSCFLHGQASGSGICSPCRSRSLECWLALLRALYRCNYKLRDRIPESTRVNAEAWIIWSICSLNNSLQNLTYVNSRRDIHLCCFRSSRLLPLCVTSL